MLALDVVSARDDVGQLEFAMRRAEILWLTCDIRPEMTVANCLRHGEDMQLGRNN
jgi:hypothetical protein